MLGKGLKRKRSREEEEEEAGSASAPPSSSLFSISVSKLHRSLQRGEPDLRHLVLVTNTLRRIQHSAQPASGPPQAPCLEDSQLSPGGRPAPPPPPPPLDLRDPLLLSGMDASVFSILEELTSSFSTALCPPAAQPELHTLCGPSPEPGRTAQLGLSSLEPPGPGGALLEEGLDSLFEDIDTSMYDCDPWASSKEGCVGTEVGRQGLTDLDYLLEVLVGTEEQ